MLLDWKSAALAFNDLLASITGSGNIAAISEPIVDLGYVKYKGITDADTGITNFYGIRFAKPPVGERRWRAPEPLTDDYFGASGETNDGFTTVPIIDATEPAPGCYTEPPYWGRGIRIFARGPQQEDCLTMNLQVPSKLPESEDELLPVLVNIHGGGYLAGTNDVAGTFMIMESNKSMIYASINYRLGLYGFLASSEVEKHGDLNAGLLDQRQALLWIKQNIAKFGGDPSRITITGDSAGGGSVTYQLTAYDGESPESELGITGGDKLFHAAYSAYPWWTPVWTRANQDKYYKNVLNVAGCSDIHCLRRLNETELLEVSGQLQLDNSKTPQDGYGLFSFSPVIDGKFVKRRPHEAFAEGKYLHVPLMLSRARKEGFAFTPQTLNQGDQLAAYQEASDDFYLKFPTASRKPEFVKDFESAYPVDKFASVFDFRCEWFQDAMINCPTYEIADSASSQGVPVYKFIFSTLSMYHGSPKFFIFSDEKEAPVFDKDGSKNMASYVVSFVKTGDPNKLKREQALTWPQYFEGESKYNVIDFLTNKQELIEDPDHREQCEFYRKYADVVSN